MAQKVNCRNQAFTLKTPLVGSTSEIGMLRQLGLINGIMLPNY
jgi:hypothetical protein